jgi:uracil-DNA glycosylase family 4
VSKLIRPLDCPIPGSVGYSEPEGSGANGVLVLGEALGAAEAHDGKPFRPWGDAGAVLERAFKRAGFTREEFRIWNVVACQPPKNWLEKAPWEGAAIQHCKPALDRVIAEMRPRCVLTLGNVPTRVMTGMAGEKKGVGYLRGYVLPSPEYGVPVVPSYHPAFLRRGEMALFSVLVHDLKVAVGVARDGVAPVDPYDPPVPAGYLTHPTEEQAFEFLREAKAHPERLLTYDIETESSRETSEEETDELADQSIQSIQFSQAPGTGIFMPWRGAFAEVARQLLRLPNEKAAHNSWRFDDPLLRREGCDIAGRVHDIRWAWKHLQPELRGHLQFVASFYGWTFPWKHLSHAKPEVYGCYDVDALQYIVPRLFEDLKRRGLWEGYQRHILRLEPILVAMSERGMPVSAARFAEVKKELEGRQEVAWAAMQAAVPDQVRAVHPKKGYKVDPKDAVEGGETAHGGEPARWGRRFFPVEKVDDDPPTGQVQVERWVKLLPWVPSGGAQGGLVRYMKFKGHPVPRDYKKGTETTTEKELVRLAKKTRDPLYQAVLEYRSAETMLNNHIKNWEPGPDERVHPTFYCDTATGQLAARRPNSQNAPKHKPEQGKLFRSMVRAREGCTLIEADYRAFHAQTLAFEARDPDYLRLAKLDIHSFLAAHLVKFPGAETCLTLPDADLGAFLREVRAKHEFVRDYKAKRAILGYGFGLGYRKLFDMNRESFSSQLDAKRTIDMLNALFPRAAAWRNEIRRQAHQQGFLLSKGGSIRYFWEVYKYDREKGWVPGEDSEAAIAFLPANDAFGHMKNAMIRLDERGALVRYSLVNQIHDSLIFECPDSLVAECIEVVREEMERPSEVLVDPLVALGGLSVEVGVGAGKSWDEMGKVG